MLNSLLVKSIIKKDIESGEISGTTEKATKDSEGNVITETYATKKESESSDKLLSTAIKEEETRSNEYTDKKIADLINGAPTTLDTLKEIADAMDENQDVVKALDESIEKKANASDLTGHTGNTNNPHNVTKEQLGLEDAVESEVATDFSEAETPQFQQTIDDVLDGVNELKGDIVGLSGLNLYGIGYKQNNSTIDTDGNLISNYYTDVLTYTIPTCMQNVKALY